MRTEISDLESEPAKKSKSEKQTLEVYENINKTGSYILLISLVANLRKEENQKQIEIDNRIKEIKAIEKEIEVLQKNYSKYVISTYKYGGFTRV
ncbi:MAG: hypothetical protein MZV64_69185 [Ignavibacteriales bacterium]|nr:hypothetical protein [Ignavibacteriales bacterium]